MTIAYHFLGKKESLVIVFYLKELRAFSVVALFS